MAGRRVRVSSPQGRFTDAHRVDGATLVEVEAYGKHLFHHWSSGAVGHIHLGLFGKFRVHRGPEPPEPRGAVRMRVTTIDRGGIDRGGFDRGGIDDGGEPVTIDLAGPTACAIGDPDDRDAIVARLGPDPLRPDADPAVAIAAMSRSRRAMGALLLDQAVLAGVGNVYRAEALFVHGIHPRRPGTECDVSELGALWTTVRDMLRAGVRANRIVTVSRSELGLAPGARIARSDATYVYKRDRCLRCGTPIEAIEVANRACYHCPTCQPA